MRSLSKRLFDIFFAVLLLVILSPVLIGVALYMILKCDLPVFYISERMKTPHVAMRMVKFRTMRLPRPGEQNAGVSGGDKSSRISPLGQCLRKYRLDEIPQLWNILKGDMSFVGPRPPLRRYVERFPDVYAEVLQCKPGVTGLASVFFHKSEERILASAKTPEETEQLYETRCIPRKAALDLIYRRRFSLCLDFWLLFMTLRKIWQRS
ncbi:MAG: sugar transferase [Paracoccaceae bacterium]